MSASVGISVHAPTEPIVAVKLDSLLIAFSGVDVPFNIFKAIVPEAALKTKNQCEDASVDRISNIGIDGANANMDLDENLNFGCEGWHLSAGSKCACCCNATQFASHNNVVERRQKRWDSVDLCGGVTTAG